MNDPIPISRSTDEPLLTTEEVIALDKARHDRHVRTGVLWFFGIIVLAFLVPLSVFLTRLALGG